MSEDIKKTVTALISTSFLPTVGRGHVCVGVCLSVCVLGPEPEPPVQHH